MNKNIDISNTVLKTERLVLRPWTMDDLDDFYGYAKVDGVGQPAGWQPHKSIEESREILKMFIDGKKVFAIEKDGKCIGSVGIEEYNEEEFPEYADKCGREIGYALSKDYWGQGIMPESVKSVIRYLFDDVKLDFILCGHFLTNNQSRRVQEKCGFRYLRNIQYKTRDGRIIESRMSIIEKNMNILLNS